MSVRTMMARALCCLTLTGAGLNALGGLVYVDAIDGLYHPGSASPNTFNANTDSATDWVTATSSGDGVPLWGYRNSGPGAVSFGASCYQGKISQSDPALYTQVGGLTPGGSYSSLRLYFVISSGNNNWRIQYSLDGAAWSSTISRDTAGVQRLVPSTTDALGTATNNSSGDTRCYYPIPGALVANASGEIRLYVRTDGVLPDTSGTYRTVYDGFAYDDGYVPPVQKASNPQPPDGAALVGISGVTTLSWSNPPPTGTLTCNVYFGDQAVYNPGNPNHFGLPLIQSGVVGSSIPVPPLTEGDSYYWMVDCVDSVTGTSTGDLWTFNVLPASVATGVLISEFMAANDATISNALGRADDWIELYNNSASTVDLAGWHFTDDDNDLVKWTFPSVLMPPGAYLVVWASNEDTVTNGQIHTSFRLGADGEYLALVRPDGVTVEHEYAPRFPEQDDDISYGVDLVFGGSDIVAIPSQAGCRYLVPATDIGSAWRERTYDDSAWASGATGLGYETSGTGYDENINSDVESVMFNQRTSVYLRIPFELEDPSLLASLRLNMLFEDGFVAYINGVEVARSNAPASPAWNAAATAARSQSQALQTATFTVAQNLATLLVSGTNILAIQGLNQTAAATTLLIQPTLEATLESGVALQQQRYYSVPTPGAANTNAFVGLVADTKFSMDRGFYSNSFSVAITCSTPGSAIRYTLDGSTPSEVRGTLYTGPVQISTTSKLRAVAYRTGWRSSNVDTHTYIFPEHVLSQPAAPAGWPSTWVGNVTFDAGGVNWSDYQMDPEVINAPHNLANDVRMALTNIPTLSLVTDLPNLFDPNTGIYANPREEGILWERPVSAEMIYPDGREGFQINCGLRIQGAGSRGPASTPKHSLRLLFKSAYGPGRLEHKLFPDSDVDSFNTLHLRAEYNNAWTKLQSDQRARAQSNRDLFGRDLQLAMGQETDHGTLCHLYINGLYWGLYHPGERPDASWASDHFGGREEDWDVLNHGDIVDGNRTAWDAMWAIANSSSALASLTAYNNFRQYCDVENFVDYSMIMHYTGNNDWDNVNWYAVRHRFPGEGWKFVAWDTEGGLVGLNDNTLTGSQNNPNGPSTLFLRATASPEFRLLVADRLHKHFFNGGPLTPAGATSIWRMRSDVVDTVIAAESARWGDFRRDVLPSSPNVIYTPNGHYYPQQSYLIGTHFPQRSAIVFNQYVAQGLYPTLAAPEFSQHGGYFTNSTTVTLSGPSAIYYTLDGSDPRQYGTGSIVGTPYAGPINLTHSTRVKARCHNGSQWSALLEADFFDLAPSTLRVSEVMYAPRVPEGTEISVNSDPQAYSFVEIHNTGSETVGLVGVRLEDGVIFDFSKAAPLSVPPGGYVVAVENPVAFAARYPSVAADKIAGEFRGDLPGDGDSLRLTVAGLGAVVSLNYADGRGWPLAADGAGHSLIPLVFADQSSGQLNYGGNWKASVNVDGSPGASEPSPLGSVALNEILAHTDFSSPSYPGYDSNDKIELINHGASTASLNGYYLSDDPADLKKWAIPAGTNVPAGGFVVFDEITGFHAPLTNGFGLDKAGEQVLLSYASGGGPASVVDAVVFKGQENGRSLGRHPDATGHWRECLPTLGAANMLAGQQPVISEIMYHPAPLIPMIDNTEDEFVELFNPTAGNVNLWVEENGTNVGSWRLDGEVDFVFPANSVLAAGDHLLVVPFDPGNSTNRAAFLARYGLSEPQNLFGPFSGKLSNEGGRAALEKPLAPDLAGEGVSWVIVDEVFYAEDTPWMPSADGLGDSLQRTLVSGAGVDPGSWIAAAPTPDGGTSVTPDLRLLITHAGGTLFVFNFQLAPGYDYTLQMRTNLVLGDWTPLTNVAHPTTQYDHMFPVGLEQAYFRLLQDP